MKIWHTCLLQAKNLPFGHSFVWCIMTKKIRVLFQEIGKDILTVTREIKEGIKNLFRSEGIYRRSRSVALDEALFVVSFPFVQVGSLMNRHGYWPELPLLIRAHTSETFDVTNYAPLLNIPLTLITGKSRPVTAGAIMLGLGITRKYLQYAGNDYGPHSHFRFDSSAFLTLSAIAYIGVHLAYKKFSERPAPTANSFAKPGDDLKL